MSEIIMGVIFAVGMFSILLFFINIYKESLTKSQQETAKLIGGVLIVLAIANIGNVIGLWG